MRKEEAIKILQSSEELFVIYSQATKMPYVTCDEETFNDQVRIYTDQEATKKYGEEKLKEKVLLMGSRVGRGWVWWCSGGAHSSSVPLGCQPSRQIHSSPQGCTAAELQLSAGGG